MAVMLNSFLVLPKHEISHDLKLKPFDNFFLNRTDFYFHSRKMNYKGADGEVRNIYQYHAKGIHKALSIIS